MKLLRALPLLILCLSHATGGALWAGEPSAPAGLKKARLSVVASDSMFATVNQGDATASMNIWIKQLGTIRGFQVETRMEIARSIGQTRQRLKEHSVDLLVLDTPDYLSLSDAGLVEAVAVGTSRGQLAAYPYLLLTNDAAGIGQLAGLRGKRIVVASRTKSNVGLIWLETLLGESRLGRAAAFFGSVEIGYRASSCVLPLFFGKIDACIVDSGNWESVKELNPQLGRLRVLARSDVLLEGLLAMPVEPHPYRREVIDSILNLHKTAAGEQLGIIFKVGQQVPAGRAMFDSMAALFARYRRLLKLPGDGSKNGQWHLQFDFDHAAWLRLLAHRLGRTVLLTNRVDWNAEEIAAAYAGQQQVEQVFRGLKDGEWLGWGPMHHWTDSKIRVHAFYCMLGISLLHYVHRQAQVAWAGISMEQLLEELRQIQEFVLLYPPQGDKGPNRVATVLSKQTLPQVALAKTLGLEQLRITPRG